MISGSVDTTNLVSSSVYSSLPDEIKEQVDKKLSQAEARLIFNLPNQADYTVNNTSNDVTTIMISLDDETLFNIQGKINNQENLQDSLEYVEQASYYKNLIMVFGGIIVVLLGIVIFAIVKSRPKKRR